MTNSKILHNIFRMTNTCLVCGSLFVKTKMTKMNLGAVVLCCHSTEVLFLHLPTSSIMSCYEPDFCFFGIVAGTGIVLSQNINPLDVLKIICI